MTIYLAFHWCDGFGNDSYLWGAYSSLETALKNVKNANLEDIKIIKTELDKDNDYDYYYYELEYYYTTWDGYGNIISEK